MRIPALFAGIFATFAIAWYGQTLVPQNQLGNLQPQTDEEGGDIYPINNSGIVQRGHDVYVAQGCFYCHTQVVRQDDAGYDIGRGWGGRRTVARDYIYGKPVELGLVRNGPDLTNIGNKDLVDASTGKPRWKPAEWLYLHLYNPRTTAADSVMPSYRYLFDKRKIAGQRSDYALTLTGEDAVEQGYEVVPTSDAQALVAYLLSLDSTHPLKEVKEEAPAK